MSRQNHHTMKRLRRLERAVKKAHPRKSIPHLGVIVRKRDVLSHRYLALHGLPFSVALTAVELRKPAYVSA